jgi:hypothetical protein
MKKIILPILIILASSFLVAPDDIECSVKKNEFYLNNVKLSPVWLLSEAMGCLGIPDNVKEGYNNAYTFDKDGIVILENKFGNSASGKIKELDIYLTQPDSDGVAPRSAFKGHFLIEKTELASSLSMSRVKSKLKDWTATNGYRPHSLKLTNGQLLLFCQFSEDENQLEKVSIGMYTVN